MVYALLKVNVGRVTQKGRGVELLHLYFEALITLSSDPCAPYHGIGLSDRKEEERKGKGILPTYLGGFLTLVPTYHLLFVMCFIFFPFSCHG